MKHFGKTVGIYTLGCKVNQYESEALAEAFSAQGFQMQSPSLPCDIYVINTCTVTAESDRKAKQFIRRAIHQNPKAYVLVTGCLSQTQPSAVASIEGVDFVCGNSEKLSVIQEAIRLTELGQKPAKATVSVASPDEKGFEAMCIKHFDRTRAYVKIEDGCENHCSYCIIPSARGRVRSKPPQEVIAEVRSLCDAGCREVVLTGIETASYGRDLDGYSLADLLEEIDRIPGIGRVRLGSLDPSLMKQDFVDRISRLSSLAHHFHISMQSGSDRILALMKRKYNRKMALEGMERLRSAMPDVQFTTDMIVGFPGETEQDFQDSVSLAEEARFLMIHVFPYSGRNGTPAATMPDQIATSEKKRRVALLSDCAARIRKEILAGMVGHTFDVLFETDEKGFSHGHTAHFIEVQCPSEVPLQGQLLPVCITGHNGEACVGEITPSQDQKGEINYEI